MTERKGYFGVEKPLVREVMLNKYLDEKLGLWLGTGFLHALKSGASSITT